MGSTLCCTKELCFDQAMNQAERPIDLITPNEYSSTIMKLKRKDLNGYFLNQTAGETQQLKAEQIFWINSPFQAKFISFSQRRFLGFRNRFEFDKKRILIASDQEVSVIGYDQFERPYELYRGSLQPTATDQANTFLSQSCLKQEELLLAEFLEDHIPSFIFVVAQDRVESRIEFRILKLHKSQVLEQEEQKDKGVQKYSNQEYIKDHLMNHIKQGNFSQQKKRLNDNIQLVPKSNIQLFKHSRPMLKSHKSFQQDPKLGSGAFHSREETENITILKGYNSRGNSLRMDSQRGTSIKFITKSKAAGLRQPTQTQIASITQSEQKFQLEEFGNLTMDGHQISQAYLFHAYNGSYLFTLNNDKKQISIFVIKSCVETNSKDIELKPYSCPKIANFRMALRATVNLEFEPANLDNYADYFILSYNDPCSFVDIYEKNGKFHSRFDMQDPLGNFNLKLHSINKIIFPRMKWSDRRLEEFERQNKLQLLKKFLVIGECGPQLTASELMLAQREEYEQGFIRNFDQKIFIMQYNIQKKSADKIKLLNIREASITCVNYGPFDNGHLLIGLSVGILIAIDTVEMEIILQEQLFDSPIQQIIMEPTNLVFVSSKNDEVVALNLIKKELHYVYLELPKKQFCTVTVPHTNHGSPDETRILDPVEEEEFSVRQNNDKYLRLCL